MAKLSEQMGTALLCQSRVHCFSGHDPCILQVLPAEVAGGVFALPVQHYVHMVADTPEKIPVGALAGAAAFAARVLLRAASDEEWPNMRRSARDAARWRKGNV